MRPEHGVSPGASHITPAGSRGAGDAVPVLSEQRRGLEQQSQELSYSHMALCETGQGISSSPASSSSSWPRTGHQINTSCSPNCPCCQEGPGQSLIPPA